MKQHLISSALAIADFIQRHPRRLTAAVAGLLLTGAGGAFAVASLDPTGAAAPMRLVSEAVPLDHLAAVADGLQAPAFTLYRSEQTRAADTPEALLRRLGIADPAAAAFLRRDAAARQAFFSRAGRNISAEATAGQELLALRTHWFDASNDSEFKRLVVERDGQGFRTRVETAPLVATQRVITGVIRSTLYAATDEARVPDSVTKQLVDIFESNVDFHRGLRKGDRFTLVYESLEADGEPVRAGRVLSAEMTNRGKTHQALWFEEQGAAKGAYYSFDGQSLRKAYLVSPLEFSRITSGFGTRNHPIYGYSREHKGVDYAAPTGTPVRSVGDGKIEFAGVQSGYGNVIYVKHRNAKDITVYAHLSRIDVKAGDNVAQGATIGAVGSTGASTGPHLHFEFRIAGEQQDPTDVLAEQREVVPVSATAKAAFARLANGMKMQLSAVGDSVDASFE